MLFDDEFRPLNPTTLSLEFVDLVALVFFLVCLPSEEPLLELFPLEDLTGFDTLIPLFVDFAGRDPLPDFTPDPAFPERARSPDFDTLIPFFTDLAGGDPLPDCIPALEFPELAWPPDLSLTFETLTKFLFFPLSSVIWVRVMSFRTLSLVIASKLSFFLIASSILAAKFKSFLATKLVTFPATEKSDFILPNTTANV